MKDAATGPVLECISREEQVLIVVVVVIAVVVLSVVVVVALVAVFVVFVVIAVVVVIVIIFIGRCATHPTSLSSHLAKKNNAFNATRSNATLS